MKHRLEYSIDILDLGFILTVWRYWWFWGQRKEIVAFNRLDDLKEYLNAVIQGHIDIWGKQ